MNSTQPFARWLDRVQPSETVVMCILASAVGLITGASVWLFKQLIEIASRFFFGVPGSAQILEVTIEAGAVYANQQRASEVSWPRACVLASVGRRRQTLLPRGDTSLRAGDVLIAVVEGEASEQVQAQCHVLATD